MYLLRRLLTSWTRRTPITLQTLPIDLLICILSESELSPLDLVSLRKVRSRIRLGLHENSLHDRHAGHCAMSLRCEPFGSSALRQLAPKTIPSAATTISPMSLYLTLRTSSQRPSVSPTSWRTSVAAMPRRRHHVYRCNSQSNSPSSKVVIPRMRASGQ